MRRHARDTAGHHGRRVLHAKREAIMSTLKTRPTGTSLATFLANVPDPQRRADCRSLAALMKKATGARAVIWGSSIVGFGTYHYRYASGHEGDWPVVGFAPRKNELTVYIVAGFDRMGDLLARLGPHRTGKSCLYVKRLSDLDQAALAQIIDRSVEAMASKRTA
jgi:hypothetical protein